jgi:hypothetical protein
MISITTIMPQLISRIGTQVADLMGADPVPGRDYRIGSNRTTPVGTFVKRGIDNGVPVSLKDNPVGPI